jgi:hypothetical protein
VRRTVLATLLVLAGCAAGPQAPLERPPQVSERDWTDCAAELDAARARSWDLAPLSGLPEEMALAGLAVLAVSGIDRTTDPAARWNRAMLACLSRRAGR